MFGKKECEPTVNIDEEFGAALMTAAAVFAFKMSFIHLLVSRSRITTDITQYGFNPIMKIFQPVLLAYPSFGTVSSEALERIEKNNSDNEPFFLLVMAIAGLTKSFPADLGVMIVTVYMWARVVWTVLSLLKGKLMSSVGTTLISISWMPTSLIPFFVGGYILLGY